MTYVVKRDILYMYANKELAMNDRQHWTHGYHEFGSGKSMTSSIEFEFEYEDVEPPSEEWWKQVLANEPTEESWATTPVSDESTPLTWDMIVYPLELKRGEMTDD